MKKNLEYMDEFQEVLPDSKTVPPENYDDSRSIRLYIRGKLSTGHQKFLHKHKSKRQQLRIY